MSFIFSLFRWKNWYQKTFVFYRHRKVTFKKYRGPRGILRSLKVEMGCYGTLFHSSTQHITVDFKAVESQNKNFRWTDAMWVFNVELWVQLRSQMSHLNAFSAFMPLFNVQLQVSLMRKDVVKYCLPCFMNWFNVFAQIPFTSIFSRIFFLHELMPCV